MSGRGIFKGKWECNSEEVAMHLLLKLEYQKEKKTEK